MAYSVMQVTQLTSSQLSSYVGSDGMIVINSDTDSLVVLDGVSPGGAPIPKQDDLEAYVNTQVSTITAAGGQVLPPTNVATTDGSVIVWDGGDWQEDNRFAFTTYVDSEIANLAPASGDSIAGQALQWLGGKLVNYTLPASGGGGGITVSLSDTPIKNILTWVGGAFQHATISSQGIAPEPPADSLPTEVLQWGAGAFKHKDLSLAFAEKPSNSTLINEVLAWDNSLNVGKGQYVNKDLSLTYTLQPTASGADEVLAWDASINSGKGGFIHKDLSGLAAIGTASAFTDLGLIEAELVTKAPKPPTGIQAGEFIRWDETNSQFTFATPAGGGGGTSIPTPAATTDYTTPAAMQLLIWDNVSGDLKNVSSPFAEKPPASSTGEYLRWDSSLNSGAGGWANSTPAGGGGGSSFGAPVSSTQANEAVTWDGTSAFVNTTGYAMLTDVAGKADEPSSYTGSNEVLKWTASGWQNSTLSSVGVSSGAFVSPASGTTAGQHVAWNGSAFENRSEFATESLLEGMFPLASDSTANRAVLTWDGVKTINKDFAPATATPSGDFVKWNGTTFENVSLSTTGMTTTGFVNPGTSSGATDALQWNGSNFVNVPNFKPDATIDTSVNSSDVLGWDGSQFYKKTVSTATGAGVLELSHDQVNNEYVLTVKASAIAAV